MGEGYTLAQLVQRVREQLHLGPQDLDTPTIGNQGLTLTEFLERVRRVLRDDSALLIPDEEITDWLNEAAIEIAWRTRAVRLKATGSVTGDLSIPASLISVLRLEVNSAPVELVEAGVWDDWKLSGQAPPRTLGRVAVDKIELYPAPSNKAYVLYYVSGAPTTLVNANDTTNVPQVWNQNMVRYAQAHAKLKDGDQQAFQFYMQLFEKDLPPGSDNVGEPTIPQMKDRPDLIRVIHNYMIVDWLNEGYLDMVVRDRLVTRETSLATTSDTTGCHITPPADYVKGSTLASTFTSLDGSSLITEVDEGTFQSWLDSHGATPNHPVFSQQAGVIRIYPDINTSVTLRYFARPTPLAVFTDQPEIPQYLQNRLIDYATAQGLFLQGDVKKATFYLGRYEDHLPRMNTNERVLAGPLNLSPAPGPFDLEIDARHR